MEKKNEINRIFDIGSPDVSVEGLLSGSTPIYEGKLQYEMCFNMIVCIWWPIFPFNETCILDVSIIPL